MDGCVLRVPGIVLAFLGAMEEGVTQQREGIWPNQLSSWNDRTGYGSWSPIPSFYRGARAQERE